MYSFSNRKKAQKTEEIVEKFDFNDKKEFETSQNPLFETSDNKTQNLLETDSDDIFSFNRKEGSLEKIP